MRQEACRVITKQGGQMIKVFDMRIFDDDRDIVKLKLNLKTIGVIQEGDKT
jgi:hypothetical protein